MVPLDDAAVKRFVAADPGGPVVMLNLLRFAPDGEAKYREYIERFNSSGVGARYGATIVYAGAGHPSLAAEGADWDLVVLVSYPSRKAFADMVNDPDYLAFEHLRAEAAAVAVLQPTTPAL